MADTESLIPAWRPFEVRVSRLERLSASFLRVTFTGEDLNLFADNGYDQPPCRSLRGIPQCGTS